MDDVFCAYANGNWFHAIFSLFSLTLDLQAEVENRAYRLGKTGFWGFLNLKLIESDMFSYREQVTAQWDVFFLSHQPCVS